MAAKCEISIQQEIHRHSTRIGDKDTHLVFARLIQAEHTLEEVANGKIRERCKTTADKEANDFGEGRAGAAKFIGLCNRRRHFYQDGRSPGRGMDASNISKVGLNRRCFHPNGIANAGGRRLPHATVASQGFCVPFCAPVRASAINSAAVPMTHHGLLQRLDAEIRGQGVGEPARQNALAPPVYDCHQLDEPGVCRAD